MLSPDDPARFHDRPRVDVDWPASAGATYCISVAVIAAIGDILFVAVRGSNIALVVALFAAIWMLTSVALLSIWLGFGKLPAYGRMIVVAIPCSILSATLDPRSFGQGFAITLLGVFVFAIPFGLLRLFGFEIKIPKPRPHDLSDDAALRPNQFSLGQMLIWSVLFSLVAALATLAGMRGRETLITALVIDGFSLTTLAIAGAVLTPRSSLNSGLLLGLLCIAMPLLGEAIAFSLGGPTRRLSDAIEIVVLPVGYLFLLASVLWGFRRLGYRLGRERLKPSSANALPPAKAMARLLKKASPPD